MILTSIDPGLTSGWAIFSCSGAFCTGDDIGAGFLIACGLDTYMSIHFDADLVIIEKPQVYRASKSKGDPNDLITLAIQVGRYQERALVAGATVELVTPAQWKGQLPKEICNRRTLKALTPAELVVVNAVKCAAGLRHNMLDAIGIGLHKFGRGSVM